MVRKDIPFPSLRQLSCPEDSASNDAQRGKHGAPHKSATRSAQVCPPLFVELDREEEKDEHGGQLEDDACQLDNVSYYDRLLEIRIREGG
jgi:hypothetical protein